MVVFDEPQIDSEGDGPYEAAVIWETYLQVIGDADPPTAADEVRRRRRDEALHETIEHPERDQRRA
jgi:hypothetical protein